MLKSDSLLLRQPDEVQYLLHPVVVLGILDHYKRRQQGQERVVGTLLGQKVGDNAIEITDCYAVAHKEADDQVILNLDYHNQMLDLHQRVNKDEVVVGWYATGPATSINYFSSLMHNAFVSESCPNPVHVLVDTDLTDSQMGIQAFKSNDVYVGDKHVLSRFEAAQLQLVAWEAEKIGVDAMINGRADDDDSKSMLQQASTILSDIENLDNSLNSLADMLEILSDYVHKVNNGEMKGDPEMGLQIAEALASVPNLDATSFNNMFNTNINDLLMTMYLSNLTRAHLALSDKINFNLTEVK